MKTKEELNEQDLDKVTGGVVPKKKDGFYGCYCCECNHYFGTEVIFPAYMFHPCPECQKLVKVYYQKK